MPAKKNYRKRNNRKNTVAKAKRKAYKPRNKKLEVAAMMPIAESRRNVRNYLTGTYLAATAGTTDHWQVLIPSSWLFMFRENYLENLTNNKTSQGFTGKTLFSRFINEKIRISFDHIRFNPNPVDLRICYGWCKIPYLTSPEAIGSDTQSNTNGVKIEYNPSQMVAEKLDKQFSAVFPRNDPKQFKMMYNKRFTVRGQDAGLMDVALDASKPGDLTKIPAIARKDLEYYISWKPNKKYHMIPVTYGDGTDGAGGNIQPDDGDIVVPQNQHKAFWTPSNVLNQDLWIPFFALRPNNVGDYGKNPAGENDTTAYPILRHQSTHYFLDL